METLNKDPFLKRREERRNGGEGSGTMEFLKSLILLSFIVSIICFPGFYWRLLRGNPAFIPNILLFNRR